MEGEQNNLQSSLIYHKGECVRDGWNFRGYRAESFLEKEIYG